MLSHLLSTKRIPIHNRLMTGLEFLVCAERSTGALTHLNEVAMHGL